jgi:hypothetical protein
MNPIGRLTLQYRYLQTNRSKLAIYLSAFLLAFNLGGCVDQALVKNQSASTQPVQKIPDWATSPPTDTASSIYGLGEGNSLEKARQNALRDIAGKLETHVRSETENRDYLRNNQLSSSFQQTIQTQVKDTKLVSYETVKSAQVNGKTWILVAMSRGDFVKDRQHHLDEISQQISDLQAGAQGKSKVEKMVAYNRISALAAQARPYVYIIRAVDAGFNSKAYLQQYDHYKTTEQKLAESTRFYISGPSDLNKVSQYLKDALQTYNFQVTNNRSQADAIIQVEGDVKKNVIFSSKTVAIVYDLLVKTPQGQLLSKQHFRLNGSSVSNYDVAFDTALRTLRKQVQDKTSLFGMLGLKAS